MNVMSSGAKKLQVPIIQVQDTSLVVNLGLRGRSSSCPCKVKVSVRTSTRGQGQGQWQAVAFVGVGRRPFAFRAAGDDRGESSSNGEDEEEEEESNGGGGGLWREREELERVVGREEDAKFNGSDLANLIRSKYGRSYDVTLIKKEFMGRNLLAMNVMWKYREQRSFPLSEEEYLLRLDDVANTLKCWGAVAHVRNTLQNVKERPRIGKAVSIFIDMDQTGGRSNEWIYK